MSLRLKPALLELQSGLGLVKCAELMVLHGYLNRFAGSGAFYRSHVFA
jgi:hypothetical protein